MEFIFGLVAMAVGLVVFIFGITMIVIVSRLVKLQLWTPLFVNVPRSEAADELPVLDAARVVLEEQGFRYVNTRRSRSLVASTTLAPGYSDVYYHQELDIRADVSAAAMPSPRMPFDVVLWNTFSDGRVLMTVNGQVHQLLSFPAKTIIADAYAPTFALHLAHHLAQRDMLPAHRDDPAAGAARLAAMAADTLPEMVRDGIAYRQGELQGEPLYALHLWAAVKAAWRMRRGIRHVKAMEARRSAAGLPAEAGQDIRHTAERLAFVRNLSTVNGLRAPRWFRWSTFAVTAVAFVALGAWWWGISVALVIGAVIAVHEAGHWAAMRLAHFRDVQVFFVPGMGAATSGEKHDANPLTHLAVYLAGPVPGLLLGMAGVAWVLFGDVDTNAWWYATLVTAILAALLINLLNLLPVMPLDGGRVVDLFIMGRMPWFRFAFGLVSGGLLMWAGFAMDDKILGGLGILALLGLQHQFRLASVSRDLLRQTVKAPLASENFAAAAARLFDFLAQPRYASWTLDAKMGVGLAILPRFLGRLPNWKETIIGLLIYAACIVAPVAMLIAFAVSEPVKLKSLLPFDARVFDTGGSHEVREPASTWRPLADQRLAAASTPAQRLDVLNELVVESEDMATDDDELHFARLLYAETAVLHPASTRHAQAALKVWRAHSIANDKAGQREATHRLQEAEAILRQRLAQKSSAADALMLGEVLLSGQYEKRARSKVAIHNEIVDLHAAYWQQSGEQLPMARTALARALDDGGQTTAAEEQLNQALADLQRLPKVDDYFRSALAVDHGWFLMYTERPQDAVRRLTVYLDKPVASHASVFGSARDAYMLAAVAARAQGNWQEVKARTAAMLVFDNVKTGNWLFDTFKSRRFDVRAGLLLVEAERKLGNAAVADKLVADMRPQYLEPKGKTPTCSFHDQYDTWRKDLGIALGENEKREFHCEEPVPPLGCPAPVPVPEDDAEEAASP